MEEIDIADNGKFNFSQEIEKAMKSLAKNEAVR
jgi:hypothetical protein